jgi:addiction module RelB/DinJ family antitoxin
MSNTTTISIRTNPKIKSKAMKVLNDFGIDLSSAINMYLNEIANKRIIPNSGFRYVPKHIMERWEDDVQDAIKNGKKFNNTKDLMRDLEN